MALVFILIGLTLVSGGGMFQAAGFLAAFSVWGGTESIHPRKLLKNRPSKFQISVGLICFALGVYYLLLGCLQYDGAPFALKAGNWWKLLRGVVGLLWPLETQTGLL